MLLIAQCMRVRQRRRRVCTCHAASRASKSVASAAPATRRSAPTSAGGSAACTLPLRPLGAAGGAASAGRSSCCGAPASCWRQYASAWAGAAGPSALPAPGCAPSNCAAQPRGHKVFEEHGRLAGWASMVELNVGFSLQTAVHPQELDVRDYQQSLLSTVLKHYSRAYVLETAEAAWQSLVQLHAMRTCIACALPPKVLSGSACLTPCPVPYAAPQLWMPGPSMMTGYFSVSSRYWIV